MRQQLAHLWRLLRLPKGFQLAIMRFTQDEFLVGLTGVVLNERKEVLVCKHTYRQTYWSLPGGYMKAKEHPTETLAREIEEETGFIVRINKILHTRTDRETARLDIACEGEFFGGEFRPSEEVTEARFLSFENLPLLSAHQLMLIKEVLDKKSEKEEKTEKVIVVPVIPTILQKAKRYFSGSQI